MRNKILLNLIWDFKEEDIILINRKKYFWLKWKIWKILYDDEWSKCDKWESKYPIRIDMFWQFEKWYQWILWVNKKHITKNSDNNLLTK